MAAKESGDKRDSLIARLRDPARIKNGMDREEAADALAALSNVEEREGFYEKLWKDFVSLQRGDAVGICEKVERYYREQASAPSTIAHTDHPLRHFDRTCPGCAAESKAMTGGYYGKDGKWVRPSKFCLFPCGERCDCMPPNDQHYSAAHDESKAMTAGVTYYEDLARKHNDLRDMYTAACKKLQALGVPVTFPCGHEISVERRFIGVPVVCPFCAALAKACSTQNPTPREEAT